jgi:hypothetical protein
MNTKKIIGIVTNIKRDDEKTILTINSKENIIAYYYNGLNINLGDKVKVIGSLNTLKENSRKVRVLSRIDSLLDDSAEPFYSLDELRVYCLTANPID